MTLLCQMVQSLGKEMQDVQNLGGQMQDGYAAESRRRQEDYNKMEEAGTAKMEEGFRNEQQARPQAQKQIMAGLENEENARQMVQIDLQAIKDKMRQRESGSGSGGTVGSEVSTAVGKGPSGTFARPPPGVAVRLNDLFLPRRMEFKGWVTDNKQCRYQGLTDTEVSNLINDKHQMAPDELKQCTDWEQTRTEQGTWPTQITISAKMITEMRGAEFIVFGLWEYKH